MDEAEAEKCEEKFTHIVFVVFKNPKLAHKLVDDTKGFRWWKNYAPSCLINNEDRWYFDRAPEPSDIYYENLNVSTCERICLGIQSFIFTMLLMSICFVVVFSIKGYQKKLIAEAKMNAFKASNYDKMKTQAFSMGATMFVTIVNFLL